MVKHQSIFADKYLKNKLASFDSNNLIDFQKIEIIKSWKKQAEEGKIYKFKEEAIQADFLNDIFGKVLDYEYHRDKDVYNLEKEEKALTDSTKADGALGFFSFVKGKLRTDTRVVIELKDARTDLDKPQYRLNDKRSPVEQAFSYASKAGGNCKWVIVSNFVEIRLYNAKDQSKYAKFDIRKLTKDEELKRFIFLMHKDRLISELQNSIIDDFYEKRQEEEQKISQIFYREYKQIRLDLYWHIKENNPGNDELELFNKTQKLLDRFIFVCFCEDVNLIPNYTFRKILNAVKDSFDFSDAKIWNQVKGLFHSIDKGNPPMNINKFNGGLFAEDTELDSLIIKDEILERLVLLSEYDFDSDLNVNILGHIFEQSISDIEEIKAEIRGENFEKKKGKRKKEGIYYTPEYITKYIVKEAVGGWLEDRKKELGFYELPELAEEDINSIKYTKAKNKLSYNKNIATHIKFWEAYKKKLSGIKVLDPACGSGAFLVQVFDFLYNEGQTVNNELAKLKLGQRDVFDLEKHILTNNIYGVDLNSESVEITKLSLWLKTADKNKELTALDQNIKCGNSLVDDPEIAGEKAFNWYEEFSDVFPGYRNYKEEHSKKLIKREPEYPTIQEIRERKLQEPNEQYIAVSEVQSLSDPSYSYKPGSKGFEKHGFDVVVGNPPYGRYSGMNNTYRKYLRKQHLFGKTADLSECFIRLVLQKILKQSAWFSFIVPKGLTYVKSWSDIREAFLNNVRIDSIMDTSKSFQDALYEMIIFVVTKNGHKNSLFTGFLRENEIEKYKINISLYNKRIFFLGFPKQYLSILEQIHQKCDIISKYIDCWYGKGGLTPKVNTSKLGLKVLTGKEIKRYGTKKIASPWYIDKRFLNAKDIARTTTEKVVVQDIVAHIENPKPHIKITATIDTCNQFCFNTVMCFSNNGNGIENKFLLCLLNSKFISFYYYYFVFNQAIRTMHFMPGYADIMPIPKNIKNIDQLPFIQRADTMLEKNKELYEIRKDFTEYISSKYDIKKPSQKLSTWDELNFKAFLKELGKKKVKLDPEAEFDLMKLFNSQQNKANDIKQIIETTDKEIDNLVYELYELTGEEIRIVEESGN